MRTNICSDISVDGIKNDFWQRVVDSDFSQKDFEVS